MNRLIAALFALATLAIGYSFGTNYTMTEGAGKTFGSRTVSAVEYATQLVCDAVAPATICASVKAASTAAAQTDLALVVRNPDNGTIADAACATAASTSCTQIQLMKFLNTAVTSAIPPGTAIIGNVGIDQTTDGTTNAVHLKAGTAIAGKFGIDQTTTGTTNGVVSGAVAYETVAASQTGQALGATGATGDYLSHCVIYPVTTGAGLVTVFDNTNAAGTNVITFTSGTLSNLAPIPIPVGALSTAGAWKVTTGANVTVTCYGKFT